MTKKTTVTTKETAIRIIRTSSREQQDLLPAKLREFERAGIRVIFDDLPGDPNWAYVAAPAELRARLFTTALLENESTVIVSARGGYGASDLLPLMPWDQLRAMAPAPKILVGFSDTSALHSALWTQLGWRGVHGPMPATTLWPEGAIGDQTKSPDIARLLEIITGRRPDSSIQVQRVAPDSSQTDVLPAIDGWLFGGCFSVLTNLIGTPFLPTNFDGAILFFEDIGEHPARLARYLNQWQQSGLLKGVRAIVWGTLTQLGQNIPDSAGFVYSELGRRAAGIPVFSSADFGHVAPNWPLGIGARATITATAAGTARLNWNFAPHMPPTGKKGVHS